MTNHEIQQLLDTDRPEDALREAERRLADKPDDGITLFLLGKALWRTGRHAQAQNAFARSAGLLGPESPAARALEYAKDILSFFNPDLLNP